MGKHNAFENSMIFDEISPFDHLHPISHGQSFASKPSNNRIGKTMGKHFRLYPQSLTCSITYTNLIRYKDFRDLSHIHYRLHLLL